MSGAAAKRTRSLLLVVLLLSMTAPARAALTEGPRLAAIYNSILAAKFDAANDALKDACPPAPEGACRALAPVVVWWQIELDPQSRRLDRQFTELADAAIAANEAWTKREPRLGEAWFYLAASYAPLAQWRVLRGERVAAARDGKRIKEALERALALDPSLDDAYFGIGLYHYYADVAPPMAKLLRWLLLLPGGDRAQGLREMQQARDRGEVLRGEADFQLHLIYLWYEQQPAKARALLASLDERYPSNPAFLRRIAEVDDQYFHDHFKAAADWRTLLDRIDSGTLAVPELAEPRAHIGLAVELDHLFETDRAIDQLHLVVTARPEAPVGALARANLLLGAAYDRIGERELARAAYHAAIEAAPGDDPGHVRDAAHEAASRKPDPNAAQAYRLQLEGWRAFERHQWTDAAEDFEASLDLAPDDPVALYRFARLLNARGDRDSARDTLERVIAARPPAPPAVLASAYVACASLVERGGDRSRAATLYRAAIDVRTGDPAARARAERALKRLTPHPRSQIFDF